MSQQKPPNTGLLIGGIVAGLVVGGSALTLLLFVLFGASVGSKNQGLAFVCEYVVAIVIGVGALMYVRRSVGFGSGFLVGLAAGLLGGTAMCNVLFGSLNNMH